MLNKPLGWAFGKAVNWAKGLLNKRNISAGNFNKGEEIVSNNSEKIIKKEDLPSYANPNWQGDSVELTKDRLKNGGFERLENNYEGAYKYTEQHKDNILKSVPANVKSSDLSFMGITPENVGVGLKGASSTNTPLWGVLKDAPEIYKTGQPFYDLSAHEFSHWVRHFVPKIDKSIYEPIIKESDNLKVYRYLNDPDEWLARGTQIKNYFGLKEGEELTEDMLRYAAQNMVKDRGYDNNLSLFFGGIKDFKRMTEYLNKYALGIATPILLLNKNNEQNREIKH